MEKALAERLRMFGIDEKQACLYLTLLTSGAKTLVELAELIEASRVEVLNTLNGLRERGMIEESSERPIKYRAVSIEAALDAAVMRHAYDLRRMERSKQEIIELVNRQLPTGPDEATLLVVK
ncbi:MAG: helix-turn-helix domain-containing protein [Halobacteriota archaeon]